MLPKLRLLPAPERTPASFAAERLRRAICSAGLTQAQAADLVGVDPRQVRRWLSGDVRLGPLELLTAVEEFASRNRRAA